MFNYLFNKHFGISGSSMNSTLHPCTPPVEKLVPIKANRSAKKFIWLPPFILFLCSILIKYLKLIKHRSYSFYSYCMVI